MGSVALLIDKKTVANVFPGDPTEGANTPVERSRLAEVAKSLSLDGVQIVSAPFADEIAAEIEARLTGADATLVWYNPIESGRDRSVLNQMLRSIAAKGVMVSAHPDVIDRMGTKEVLYQTRGMSWGCVTRRYGSLEAMQTELPDVLLFGPRVLKQMRGQSGDRVWKVELVDGQSVPHVAMTSESLLRFRHAKRGAV